MDRIVKLHGEVAGNFKLTVEKMIEIGGELHTQRESLDHGQWLPWIKANLPFSYKTVERYVSCWENRAKLKLDRLSNLESAYKMLTNGNKEKKANVKSMKTKTANTDNDQDPPIDISAKVSRNRDNEPDAPDPDYDPGADDPGSLTARQIRDGYPAYLAWVRLKGEPPTAGSLRDWLVEWAKTGSKPVAPIVSHSKPAMRLFSHFGTGKPPQDDDD